MGNIIQVRHGEKIYRVAWCMQSLDNANHDLFFSSLTGQEKEVTKKYKVGSRMLAFAGGRYCAKQALVALGPSLMYQSINIGVGAWGYPFIDDSRIKGQYNISIAHTDKAVIAICADGGLPVGVDIEAHKTGNDALILSQLTDKERKFLNLTKTQSQMLHMLWAAKEAAAKALRTGFRLPGSIFEVSTITQKGGVWHLEFGQLGVLAAVVVEIPDGFLALALPGGSEVVSGLEWIM